MILVFLLSIFAVDRVGLEVDLEVDLETQLKRTKPKTKNNGFVMQFHSFLEFVPKIQELSLPGLSEQLTMAPTIRKQLLEKPIINPNKAAVICLFYEGIHGETYFYLIRRSSYPGVHSNQVGFPGGQIDPSDQTPWHAAKRELWEELGISSQQITQIREITPCISLQAIFGFIVFWRIQQVKLN